MQSANHKSLTAYIREQTWPRIILPSILMVITGLLLLSFPELRKGDAPIQSLHEAVSLVDDTALGITVTAGPFYDAGLDLRAGGKERARVYYSFEDGTCYLAILTINALHPYGETIDHLTFTATRYEDETAYQRICSHIAEAITFNQNDVANAICPIILNEYDYNNGFLYFAIIALHIMFCLAALGFLYLLAVLIHPSLSICVLRLHRTGKARVQFKLATKEFAEAIPIGRRNLYVTESFFIALLKDDIVIQPLSHITWIYQTHKVHHPHGQARMVHELCVVNDSKKTHHIPHLSEPVIASLINAIATKAPNIRIGNAWTMPKRRRKS